MILSDSILYCKHVLCQIGRHQPWPISLCLTNLWSRCNVTNWWCCNKRNYSLVTYCTLLLPCCDDVPTHVSVYTRVLATWHAIGHSRVYNSLKFMVYSGYNPEYFATLHPSGYLTKNQNCSTFSQYFRTGLWLAQDLLMTLKCLVHNLFTPL